MNALYIHVFIAFLIPLISTTITEIKSDEVLKVLVCSLKQVINLYRRRLSQFLSNYVDRSIINPLTPCKKGTTKFPYF